MSWTAKIVVLALGSAYLGACSAGDVEPDGSPDVLMSPSVGATASAVPNLGGDDDPWNWSNVEILAISEAVAILLNIPPEGALTHATCTSSGTMNLTQTGATFDGDAIRTANSCTTKGGWPFFQPGTGFTISEGRITGGSASFSFSSPFVSPCPHHVVISTQAGRAVALSGTGHCILPGHPQSDVQAPFPTEPPRGLSKTVEWKAWR
jgi:hypothetical protein